MKFLNIGGACGVLENKGKRILFDPWLENGIMNNSWFHYPPITSSINDISKVDYIYISHIHEDHCHADTLRMLSRDAEIILMDRGPEIPNFVMRFLNANKLSFKKVHLIKPWTPSLINGEFMVDMLTADPDHEYNYLVDSAAIIKWDGVTIYNSNDCSPYKYSIEYIKKTYGKVNLALLPYSGGSAYPGCYSNLSHEEKLAEKDRIAQASISKFIDDCAQLQPELVMPFADQYVIGGSMSAINKYLPHPPCPGSMQAYIEKNLPVQKLLLLNPGQAYDFETGNKVPDIPYIFHTDEQRKTYINGLADHKYGHEVITIRDSVTIPRILTAARNRLWEIQKRQNNFPDYIIYFSLSDKQETYKIDLKEADVEFNPDILGQEFGHRPYLKISLTSTLLVMTLINHIPWNMSEAFMDFYRAPNIFNKEVYALLNNLII